MNIVLFEIDSWISLLLDFIGICVVGYGVWIAARWKAQLEEQQILNRELKIQDLMNSFRAQVHATTHVQGIYLETLRRGTGPSEEHLEGLTDVSTAWATLNFNLGNREHKEMLTKAFKYWLTNLYTEDRLLGEAAVDGILDKIRNEI